MKLFLRLIFIVSSTGLSAQNQGRYASETWSALQGSWIQSRLDENGEAINPYDMKWGKTTSYIFRGDSCFFHALSICEEIPNSAGGRPWRLNKAGDIIEIGPIDMPAEYLILKIDATTLILQHAVNQNDVSVFWKDTGTFNPATDTGITGTKARR